MEATCRQLMLFTEASLNDPAKTSLSLASKGACPVSAPASGTRCSELLVSLDPLTSLLKMCVERAISPCQPSYPVWKEKATKCGQASFQLLLLERRTSVKDSSSSESGAMWPTPTQRDWKDGSAEACRNVPVNSLLGRAVHCGLHRPEGLRKRMERGMPLRINDQVNVSSPPGCGQLSPLWVEILMGYPIGWTDPDCEEPEPWPGWPAMMGERQYPYEPPRTGTGIPNRAKRLKALGNSVVPAQAYPFFEAIAIMEEVRTQCNTASST